MNTLSGKDSIELTIRTAMLIQSASELIGIRELAVAKVAVMGVKRKLFELEKFIDTQNLEESKP